MEVELYFCYSLNQRKFLQENGMKYKCCALNPNSKERFWIFIKDEILNNLLTKWSLRK